MTREEMQQLINELIDERQELSLTVGRLADDNHTLRQRVEILEAENAAQREKLKRRSKTVKKVKETTPEQQKYKQEVFRMKEYVKNNPVPPKSMGKKYYKKDGQYYLNPYYTKK